MLDIKFIRKNVELVREVMKNREQEIYLDRLLFHEKERRSLLMEVEELKRQRNEASNRIGLQKQKGENAEEEIGMREVSRRIKDLDQRHREIESFLEKDILMIPNLCHSSVPLGKDSQSNTVVRVWGESPRFSFSPKPHTELGEALGVLDFQRGAKIAGARFSVYWGLGARLERALMNFMLDIHANEHGYEEILPPFLANRESLIGTGNLPKFEKDLFKTEEDGYYLIPTAEVPLTNLHQGEILAGEGLPFYYTAYTPCFRREAGSYGRETTGLIRQHQFNKVELMKYVKPENSYEELEKLTRDAEEILKRLGLHYRVAGLCTGDLGFASAKTYDLEVWIPSQDNYREISSCSNFEDFQARRANIRYRETPQSKPRYVHTLNGSGLAIGRTVVALLENYQQADGSVLIPEELVPYMGGVERIAKKNIRKAT